VDVYDIVDVHFFGLLGRQSKLWRLFDMCVYILSDAEALVCFISADFEARSSLPLPFVSSYPFLPSHPKSFALKRYKHPFPFPQFYFPHSHSPLLFPKKG
jgi:hypothetical protein